MRTEFVFVIFGIVVSGLSLVIVSASAEESIIPDWVKNTAGFWADNRITDIDFINAMQYLISNKILKIPSAGDTNQVILLKDDNGQLRAEIKRLKLKIDSLDRKIEDLKFKVDVPVQKQEDLGTLDKIMIKSNVVEIKSYEDLIRNNEDYLGKIIYLPTAKIISIHPEDSDNYSLQIGICKSVQGYQDCTDDLWMTYSGQRFLKNDNVEVWAKVTGLVDIEYANDKVETIPEIQSLITECLDCPD